jgi:hypothetical protein
MTTDWTEAGWTEAGNELSPAAALAMMLKNGDKITLKEH